jgi:hypothetical protein
VIGAAFTSDGIPIPGAPEVPTVLVPLPHPSGQSRWLNDPARIALLDRALVTMSHMVAWADPDG